MIESMGKNLDKEAEMVEPEGARADVWLWAVRLFKTRTLASEACRNHQIRVNGQGVKPSRQIRPDDRLKVKKGFLTRTVRVKAVLNRRVGARKVEDYLEDLTPPETYEEAREAYRQAKEAVPLRDAGAGRPTKKERRDLDELVDEAEQKEEFMRKVMKSVKRTGILVAAGLFFFSALMQSVAADPPARSFQPSDKSLSFQISKNLLVTAEEILPSMDEKTGLMTGLSATGSVLIKAKPEGAPSEILVSCDKATYDAARDEVVLTGWPAVKSGMQILRATSSETYVRVNRASGKWEIQGAHRIDISLGGSGKKGVKDLFKGGLKGKR